MIAAMLILAFGPLDWEFPWWIWLIAIVDAISKSEDS